jgi:hypothetical protein
MAEGRPIRALGVEREGIAAIFDEPEPPCPDGCFRVDTLYSGLSAGTELTFFKGTNPYLRGHWDTEWGVFRQGDPAEPYPVRRMGYMEVGRVRESRARAVRTGEVLAMRYGHRTSHVADPTQELFVALAPDVEPLLGIYVAQMGPIAANGLLHAAADVMGRAVATLGDGVRGRVVLVTGAGVVGLLTALFAAHHGADAVLVADVSPRRLAAAQALGLDVADEREVPAWQACKERWRHGPGDRGADVVFQCRGQVAQLHGALRAARPQGTVVDLAFYQGGAGELRLGEEFHHNRLTIRCAQVGRVPAPLAEDWDRRRLAEETIDLLRAHGTRIRDHVITDVVALEDGPQLLADLAARRREVIQAVLAMAPDGQ